MDRYLDAGDPAVLDAARRLYAAALAAAPDDADLLNDYGSACAPATRRMATLWTSTRPDGS
jgi:hypothetical protein